MINVGVFIPRHCSALTHEDVHAINNKLYVQCKCDRVIWNFFSPLFIKGNSTETSCAVLAVILRSFQACIQWSERDTCTKGDILHRNEWDNLPDEDFMTTSFLLPSSFYHQQERLFFHGDKKSQVSHSSLSYHTIKNECQRNNTNRTSIELHPLQSLRIFFLPPLLSSPSSLRSERIFTSYLVQQENLNIRLQSLNAYIATLGGGYFLCRYLTTAVRFAQCQRNIAYALNDDSLAMKCTINEAYNYIYAGNVKHARVLIGATLQEATEYDENGNFIRTKDELIASMCRSAKWFADKVEEASLITEETDHVTNVKLKVSQDGPSKIINDVHKTTADVFSLTNDDFQRIRIVRNQNISEASAGAFICKAFIQTYVNQDASTSIK